MRAGGLAGRRYKCFDTFDIEGSCESRNYHGRDWRAGGLADRRYKYNVDFNEDARQNLI